MTLRRRTGRLLGTVFITCAAPALIGAPYLFWTDPAAASTLALAGLAAGVGVARSFGDPRLAPGLVIGAFIALLLVGACGLSRLGVPFAVVYALAIGAGASFLAILVRAVIAGGSADYPYDW